MGSSTQTTSLLLPQFSDNDKPTWRGDVNDAFNKIDAAHVATASQLATHTTEIAANVAAIAANGVSINNLTATKASKSELVLNITDYGPVGTADDTSTNTAFLAACEALAVSDGVESVLAYYPAGNYTVDRFVVPPRVSLIGDGKRSTHIINHSTDGQVFCLFTGSNTSARGIHFDGKRTSQTVTGLATVQFARPNCAAAGGANLAGGMILTNTVAVGDTTLTVNDASCGGVPVEPGEIITLVEGSTYEMMRVANSYNGGNVILLEEPTINAFTVAAYTTVAICHNTIRNCRVDGNGRDAIAFWHAFYGLAEENYCYDYEDTGCDFPSAGSRYCKAVRNTFETHGRWGVYMDTAEVEFGRVSDCSSEFNTIRFLAGGGAYVGGNRIDGIGFGVVDRCHSRGDTVDLTHGGISGARFSGDTTAFAQDCTVSDITVIAPVNPGVDVYGVRNTAGKVDGRNSIIGGNIYNAHVGINLDTAMSAIVHGVTIVNPSTYGINVTADNTVTQLVSIVGCHTVGGISGVRFGGAPNAASKASVTGCVSTGYSGTPITFDAGWTVTETGNIG